MAVEDSGKIRLSGLTSGFDTQAIIEQMLIVDQRRIDDLEEEVEINKAKISTWEDVAEQLKTFADAVNTLRSDGTAGNTLYDNKDVTSSASTVTTATASSNAVESEYSVVVSTLAKAQVCYGSQKASDYTLPSSGTIILNGESISLTAGMSLQQVATAINVAPYQANQELTATVIDNRLVIQTQNTGTSQSIFGTTAGSPPFDNAVDDPDDILEDELDIIHSNGNILNESQASSDAEFSVNGIDVTRSSNTVTDVIANVTMNIFTTGSTTLDISVNTTKIKEAVEEFVDVYNETRDFINRTRNAKLDEDDQFGLFFSDSLLRELYNEVRSLTTTGVTLGGADWEGTVQMQAGASTGATSLTLNGFDNATGTLNVGDSFVIAGDSTVYKLQNSATISGNAATIEINPPLTMNHSASDSVNLAIRTLEDFGVGVRTDTVSGIEGILGVLDEGDLDSILASDVSIIKAVFARTDTSKNSTGVARRLYSWIDQQTKISYLYSSTRAIDDVKIPGLEDTNVRLDEQIERLEERLEQKEETLIQQFSKMESAISSAQSAGSAITGIAGGGQSG